MIESGLQHTKTLLRQALGMCILCLLLLPLAQGYSRWDHAQQVAKAANTPLASVYEYHGAPTLQKKPHRRGESIWLRSDSTLRQSLFVTWDDYLHCRNEENHTIRGKLREDKAHLRKPRPRRATRWEFEPHYVPATATHCRVCGTISGQTAEGFWLKPYLYCTAEELPVNVDP